MQTQNVLFERMFELLGNNQARFNHRRMSKLRMSHACLAYPARHLIYTFLLPGRHCVPAALAAPRGVHR